MKRHECWGSCLITTDALLELSESFSVSFLPPFCTALKFPQQRAMASILNSLIFLGMKEACKSFEHAQPWKFSLVIQGECFGFLSELPLKIAGESDWFSGQLWDFAEGACETNPRMPDKREPMNLLPQESDEKRERSFQREATLASPSFPP